MLGGELQTSARGAASSRYPRFPQVPPRTRPRPAPPRPPPGAALPPRLGGAGAGSGWLRAAAAVAEAAGSGSRSRPQRVRRRKPRGQRPTRGDPLGGSAPRPAPPRPIRSGGDQGVGGGPGGTEAGSGGRLFPRPHPAGLLRGRERDAGGSESPAGNERWDHMVMGGRSRATLHWLGPPKPSGEGRGQIPGPLPSAGRGRMGPADRWAGGGAGTGPQPGSPAQLGERLPVSCLPLKLVLPEHGVGLRAGQKGGPAVSSFKMERSPTGS